jgi:hypothetical protein
MHVLFIQIYFPAGAIQDCSISETITSMEYVTMFFYKEIPGISVTLLQGASVSLWLDRIARTGKKDGLRELLGGGMAKTISSLSLTNVIK